MAPADFQAVVTHSDNFLSFFRHYRYKNGNMRYFFDADDFATFFKR